MKKGAQLQLEVITVREAFPPCCAWEHISLKHSESKMVNISYRSIFQTSAVHFVLQAADALEGSTSGFFSASFLSSCQRVATSRSIPQHSQAWSARLSKKFTARNSVYILCLRIFRLLFLSLDLRAEVLPNGICAFLRPSVLWRFLLSCWIWIHIWIRWGPSTGLHSLLPELQEENDGKSKGSTPSTVSLHQPSFSFILNNLDCIVR